MQGSLVDILRILQTSSRSVISLSGANRDAGPCYHHLMWHILCITRNRRDSTVQLSSSISFRAVSLLRPGGFSPLRAHDNIPYFFPPPFISVSEPQLLPSCFLLSKQHVFLWSSTFPPFPLKPSNITCCIGLFIEMLFVLPAFLSLSCSGKDTPFSNLFPQIPSSAWNSCSW